eukprot:12060534-Karenia_brevis.AAC.1
MFNIVLSAQGANAVPMPKLSAACTPIHDIDVYISHIIDFKNGALAPAWCLFSWKATTRTDSPKPFLA